MQLRKSRPAKYHLPVMKAARWFIAMLALLAVLSCAALLAVGAIPLLGNGALVNEIANGRAWAITMVSPFAAAALILAGASFIGLQAILRPPPLELLKRMMLGLAFVLWGITALMPSGALTTELGNVVIALYVVDLGLMIRGDLRRKAEADGQSASRRARSSKDAKRDYRDVPYASDCPARD